MTKIAFITFGFTSFMRQDYESLSKHYDVEHVTFTGISDILKIVTAVRVSDISYSWFADVWAFFAVVASKIFGKKSIVVVGGYDVADEPEIDYGMGTKNILRQQMRTVALKYADIVLPVSQFTQHETERYTKNNIKMVYNAVDSEKFKPNGEKEKLVLTVGNKIKLKGIDTFVAAAWHHPDTTFMVIGMCMSEDSRIDLERYCNIPNNLIFARDVPYDNMVTYYQRAKVYCQLSYRESFGMALAEAMACGCVPVVADRGAMPEVVGDSGIYVPYGDTGGTASAIRQALKSDKGEKARQRVEKMFPLEKRETELGKIIRRLLN